MPDFHPEISLCNVVVCLSSWNCVVALEGGALLPAEQCRELEEVAAASESKWNVPHCLGAVDGKHVQIQALANSGSAFFNYKGTFSINLMAVSEAYYKFLSADVDESGCHDDGGAFRESGFGHALLNNLLPLQPDEELPPVGLLPYYLVAIKLSHSNQM